MKNVWINRAPHMNKISINHQSTNRAKILEKEIHIAAKIAKRNNNNIYNNIISSKETIIIFITISFHQKKK